MFRTISLKLDLDEKEANRLVALRKEYLHACNAIVADVVRDRCWNRVALHKIVYGRIRSETKLGSQMVCNSIFSVCKAYKAQEALGRIEKEKPLPVVKFKRGSVHFDKKTYSFDKQGRLSLYTLSGRIAVPYKMGVRQRAFFESGAPKEAELICKGSSWYFNLVLEFPDPPKKEGGEVIGVDIGENNIAAMSTGKIYGGGKLRDDRDRYLAQRRRLQSNGTQSAKQLLCKVSGREARHVRHVNHQISSSIVLEAQRAQASAIVLEDLTNIRENIRGSKRIKSRLHRWPFSQLQQFIEYKSESVGIQVVYVNPAYSSSTCSRCLSNGTRSKHLFTCSCCGLLAHADCNASRNLARIVESADSTRAKVNWPNVDTLRVP